MADKILSALVLSIVSSPAKAGVWDSLFDDPIEILNSMDRRKLKTQEHLVGLYGENPEEAAEKIYKKCIESNFQIITRWDEDYPALLREIYKPPIILFQRGSFTTENTVSIVGTRSSDKKSEEITTYIAGELADNGYTVVSGMALGIDRCAHLGALKRDGATVAILPNGPDVVYPYKNRDLFNMIDDSPVSGFLTEYPPGIIPSHKWTFARRNRIISGISRALILTQAPVKSGAMITARYAMEHNRDLFVCPGNAFDKSYEGCHQLLRDGAAIAASMEDILTGLDPEYRTVQKNGLDPGILKEVYAGGGPIEESLKPIPEDMDPAQRRILEHIGPDSADADTVIRTSGISPDQAGQAFTMLEISGYIARKGNRLFRKK